ncbi:MAG TPA: Gfo/Idh/MocA family oxidoreductase [Candidatus Dormibacteraeota bacterium]|nr:Gfo/Idh/MocA family oxidoreductase [Candidatus Dormibacteraeota bacterium]
MTASNLSRRKFLELGGLTLTGSALSAKASSYARILGANDRVRVGVVGFSDRFQSALAPSFLAHAKELNFELSAISDIWNRRREEGVAHLHKLTNREIAPARNNEELYARADIDAVIIATADFQHAQHAIQAVKAGRDVYVEKPLAHTMEDAREIRAAVRSTGKIFQVGTQRRSAANYGRAFEFIRSGAFGDIVSVEMTWNVNQPGRWRRPQLVAALRERDTDWKRFLINRPFEPFDARKYVEFRLFWPYSCGIPDQWMVHQIDTVHWFTGLPRPRSVVANGGIYLWHDGRKNWDTMTAVFDYGPLDDPSKGFQVVYSSRQTNSAGSVKELYYSNGGLLDLDKNVITSEGGLDANSAGEMNMKSNQLQRRSLASAPSAVETAAAAGGDDATSAHMRNWMECVRSRKTPNAGIEAGYSHSIAICMTVAAIQSGRRVTFDDSAQEVVLA